MNPWSRSLLLQALLLLRVSRRVLTAPEAIRHDCQASDRDIERAWSEDKKAWCCQHEGRGCLAAATEDRLLEDAPHPHPTGDEPAPAALAPPSDDEPAATNQAEQRRPDFANGEYDCIAGYIRWESGWSLAKKTWCCFHEGRGCTPGQIRVLDMPGPGPDNQEPEPTPTPSPPPSQPQSPSPSPSLSPSPSPSPSPSTTSTVEPPSLTSTVSSTRTATNTTRKTRTTQTATSTTTVDCQKATAEEQASWSHDQLKYCCLSAGTGCAKLTTVVTTTSTKAAVPPEYDCSVGLSYWKELWSVEKKAYCCENQQKGCPDSSPPATQYDCLEDLENWRDEWDKDKKTWCCAKQGLGCGTTTAWEPFDCTLSERGWSTEKLEWCCAKKNRGCGSTTATTMTETSKTPSTSSSTSTTTSSSSTTTTTSTTRAPTTTSTSTTTTVSWKYNCQADSDRAHEWPDKKREWCCDLAGVGCKTSTSPPYDCNVAYNNWAAGWSDTKKTWCCKTERRGCVPTVTSTSTSTTKKSTITTTTTTSSTTTTTSTTESSVPLHDCSKDFDKWRMAWSISKMLYCCEVYHRGCDDFTSTTSTSSTTLTSLTSTTTTTYTKTTTTTKTAKTTTISYDCHRGYSTWEHTWSHKQKDWCCQHEGLGCHNQSSPYDCQAGFNNWEAGWSEGKKVWCCDFRGVACRGSHETTTSHHQHNHHHHGASTTTRAFVGTDCAEGIGNTQEWPSAKKEFCCSYAGIACSADDDDDAGDRDEESLDPFDCYAGYVYTNWEETWSEEKKTWCCQKDPTYCHHGENHSKPSLYDCNKDAHYWRTDWSVGKRAWCCLHDKKKCLRVVAQERPDPVKDATHHTPNCTHGAENWDMAWSVSKKDYCCRHGDDAGLCTNSFSTLFITATDEQPLQAGAQNQSFFQTSVRLAVASCCCTTAMAALVALVTSRRLRDWTGQGHQSLAVVPLVSDD